MVRPGVRGHDPARVPPFGHLRIDGCLPLPADYRSLPRPSSASCAKASAVRLVYLLFPKAAPRGRGAVSSFYRYCIPEALASRDRAGHNGPLVMMPSMSRAMQMSRCPGRAPERRPGALGAGCCGLFSWTGPDGPLSSRSRELRSTASGHRTCLPRKEVIQPHLPVRLPCYDFTPLTLHTFDASAPFGFGRRLRVQTTRVV